MKKLEKRLFEYMNHQERNINSKLDKLAVEMEKHVEKILNKL